MVGDGAVEPERRAHAARHLRGGAQERALDSGTECSGRQSTRGRRDGQGSWGGERERGRAGKLRAGGSWRGKGGERAGKLRAGGSCGAAPARQSGSEAAARLPVEARGAEGGGAPPVGRCRGHYRGRVADVSRKCRGSVAEVSRKCRGRVSRTLSRTCRGRVAGGRGRHPAAPAGTRRSASPRPARRAAGALCAATSTPRPRRSPRHSRWRRRRRSERRRRRCRGSRAGRVRRGTCPPRRRSSRATAPRRVRWGDLPARDRRGVNTAPLFSQGGGGWSAPCLCVCVSVCVPLRACTAPAPASTHPAPASSCPSCVSRLPLDRCCRVCVRSSPGRRGGLISGHLGSSRVISGHLGSARRVGVAAAERVCGRERRGSPSKTADLQGKAAEKVRGRVEAAGLRRRRRWRRRRRRRAHRTPGALLPQQQAPLPARLLERRPQTRDLVRARPAARKHDSPRDGWRSSAAAPPASRPPVLRGDVVRQRQGRGDLGAALRASVEEEVPN